MKNFDKIVDLILVSKIPDEDKNTFIAHLLFADDKDLGQMARLFEINSLFIPEIVENLKIKLDLMRIKDADSWKELLNQEKKFLKKLENN